MTFAWLLTEEFEMVKSHTKVTERNSVRNFLKSKTVCLFSHQRHTKHFPNAYYGNSMTNCLSKVIPNTYQSCNVENELKVKISPVTTRSFENSRGKFILSLVFPQQEVCENHTKDILLVDFPGKYILSENLKCLDR